MQGTLDPSSFLIPPADILLLSTLLRLLYIFLFICAGLWIAVSLLSPSFPRQASSAGCTPPIPELAMPHRVRTNRPVAFKEKNFMPPFLTQQIPAGAGNCPPRGRQRALRPARQAQRLPTRTTRGRPPRERRASTSGEQGGHRRRRYYAGARPLPQRSCAFGQRGREYSGIAQYRWW